MGANRATGARSPVSLASITRLKSRSNRSRGDIWLRSGGVPSAETLAVSAGAAPSAARGADRPPNQSAAITETVAAPARI
jgi:hypothetical protein